MDEVKKWRGIDSALAVGAAVIVAYGVLVLQWSVFVVIALFWFENVVIGVLNVAKMLISGARIGGFALIAALALAAFFTVHYGMFTVAHGVFVVALFGKSELGDSANGLFAPQRHTFTPAPFAFNSSTSCASDIRIISLNCYKSGVKGGHGAGCAS